MIEGKIVIENKHHNGNKDVCEMIKTMQDSQT